MEGSFTCESCSRVFPLQHELQSHMLLSHTLTCPFCEFTVKIANDMKNHMTESHQDLIDGSGLEKSEVTESKTQAGKVKRQGDDSIFQNNTAYNSKHAKIHPTSSSNYDSNSVETSEKIISCVLCSFSTNNVEYLHVHLDKAHFSTSDSATSDHNAEEESGISCCPFCDIRFATEDLQLHVDTAHKEATTPSDEDTSNTCPVCGIKSTLMTSGEFTTHVEMHFNQDGERDRLFAEQLQQRETERFQDDQFQMLREGMGENGNYKEQSIKNMRKSVYSGNLSVSKYYERQMDLKKSETIGIDDGYSCINNIMPKIARHSNSSRGADKIYLCTDLDFYCSSFGDKGWGCGYRNTQMLISSLLRNSDYKEKLKKMWQIMENVELPTDPNAMPSITKIQKVIQSAWSEGFDTEGSEQLNNRVFNTRKWIGATEVVVLLSFLGIKCQLMDFHKPTGPCNSHPEMLKWVLDYFRRNPDFCPPLYLQHQGHSRTIVGIELAKNGDKFLLILDPGCSMNEMLKINSKSFGSYLRIRYPLDSLMQIEYQIVSVEGVLEPEDYTESKRIKSIRIP